MEDILFFFKRQGIVYWSTKPGPRQHRSKILRRVLTRLAAAPCMLGMEDGERWGSYGHWVVAYGYEARQKAVRYLDPQYRGTDARHDSLLLISDVEQCWDGSAISIRGKYP